MAGAADPYRSRPGFRALNYEGRIGGVFRGGDGQQFNRQQPTRSSSQYYSQPGGAHVRTASSRSEPFNQGGSTMPEFLKQVGLVIEVHQNYGRILCSLNFDKPSIHVIFSLATRLASEQTSEFISEPLSAITEDLTDLFRAGDAVEVCLEGPFSVRSSREDYQLLVPCISISLRDRERSEPQLVPMLVIQEGGPMPLAMTAKHEVVALHPQVFPCEAVAKAIFEDKRVVNGVNIEWPEFALLGHSVEGRILKAPRWVTESVVSRTPVSSIALSLQSYGLERAGFATVTRHIDQGIVLAPIDKEDLQNCGEIFFPNEMSRSNVDSDIKKGLYPIGSKWYFRACRELPGRSFKYRAYSIDDLTGVGQQILRLQIPLPTASQHQPSQPSAAENASLSRSTTGISSGTSTEGSPLSDYEIVEPPLIDVMSNGESRSENAARNMLVVSPETLDLLAGVDFTNAGVVNVEQTLEAEETPLLKCSPLQSEEDIATLVDLSSPPNKTARPGSSISGCSGERTVVDYSPLRADVMRGVTSSLASCSHDYSDTSSESCKIIDYSALREVSETESAGVPNGDDLVMLPQLVDVGLKAPFVEKEAKSSVAVKAESTSPKFKKFHVLDESFDSSTLDFDTPGEYAETKRQMTYAAEMCGCSDDDDTNNNAMLHPSVCASAVRSKLNGVDAQLNSNVAHISELVSSLTLRESNQQEEKGEVDLNDVMYISRNDSLSEVIRMTCGGKRDVVKKEVDKISSDSDSDNDLPPNTSFAIRVERRDDDGWWFTRKNIATGMSGSAFNSLDVKATASDASTSKRVFSSLNYESSNFIKVVNRTRERDRCDLLMPYDKTDQIPSDQAAQAESGSSSRGGVSVVDSNGTATSPTRALTSELCNDDVYAKFFTGVLPKSTT